MKRSATLSSLPPFSTGCSTTAMSSPSAVTATDYAKSDGVAFCKRPLRRLNRLTLDQERGPVFVGAKGTHSEVA